MKYIVLSVIAMLISMPAISLVNESKVSDNEKEVVATFKEVTDEMKFKFVNEKGEYIYFDEIHDDVEINLYDDENLEVKFNVFWTEEEFEELDEEGDPTGETSIVKTITKLVVA
jgi:hypothetical protein